MIIPIIIGTLIVISIVIASVAFFLHIVLPLARRLREKEEVTFAEDEETAILEAEKFKNLYYEVFSTDFSDHDDEEENYYFSLFLNENEDFIEYKLSRNEFFLIPKETYALCKKSFFQYLDSMDLKYEERETGTLINVF